MQRHIVMALSAAALGVYVLPAMAAPVKSPVTTEYSKIKQIDSYSGDTTVFLEKNPAGCEQGFWMRPGHANFKNNLKLIENAAHENTRVKILGDKADQWKQLADPDHNCRLENVSVEPVANPGTKADTDGEKPVDERKVREEEEAKKSLAVPNQPQQ